MKDDLVSLDESSILEHSEHLTQKELYLVLTLAADLQSNIPLIEHLAGCKVCQAEYEKIDQAFDNGELNFDQLL